MKAIHVNEPGNENVLRLAEISPPALSPGHVRIDVRSAGLNRADILQRRGFYPPPPGAPETLGLECAGFVTEVDPETAGFAAGDRVMALVAGGGQAEEAVIHQGSLLSVPAMLTDVEAGAFPEVFLTAYLNLFILGGFEPGMTALVHGGSGGVGTAAIRLVKEAGGSIIVTAGSTERCRRCIEIGADVAVDYHESDFEKVVRELTTDGVEVILDCVGGAYLGQNLGALRSDGRLVVIGLMGGAVSELDMRPLLAKRLQIIGSTLRALSNERKAEIVRSFLARFGEALGAGRLRPVIDSVFPMTDVADAHRRLASGDAFGKVVLTVP